MGRPPADIFVSLGEAARLLNVTRPTLQAWIDAGVVPASRRRIEGPGVWIRRDELAAVAEPILGPNAAAIVGADSEPLSSEAMTRQMLAGFLAELSARQANARPVFHYTRASTALDHILLTGQLRLNPLAGVNDPFESEPRLPNLRGETDLTGEEVLEVMHQASDLLRVRCRLLCLTSSGTNEYSSLIGFGNGYARARMWAQYAENHAGVCLAFDQALMGQAVESMAADRGLTLYHARVRYVPEEDPLPRRPIEIPSTRARRGLAKFIDRLFPGAVSGLYFSTAWDWSTESEYRFLVHGNVDDYEYVDITKALTGIFVGHRFPPERLDDLRRRCPHLAEAGRIYQLRWHNGMAVSLPFPTDGHDAPPRWLLPPAPVDPD